MSQLAVCRILKGEFQSAMDDGYSKLFLNRDESPNFTFCDDGGRTKVKEYEFVREPIYRNITIADNTYR